MTRKPATLLPAPIVCLALLTTAVPVLPAAPPAKGTSGPAREAGLEAFDLAFRFASAIVTDSRDRASEQSSVLLDLAEAGDPDGAERQAEAIVGWRRGLVLAELAARRAAVGQTAAARALVGAAEQVRRESGGWEERRLAAHIAWARAALGEVDESRRIASELAVADPRQYSGRSAATIASALAENGSFDEAMAELERLGTEKDIDIALWRLEGYLALARRAGSTPDQASRALDAAAGAAELIDGWKRAEGLARVAGELARRDRARAVALLREAEPVAAAVPDTAPVKAGLLAALGRSLGKAGEIDRARSILRDAERSVPRTLVIDRPAGYAGIAASYQEIGDGDEAQRLFGAALASAESLENSRPRALALSAICRSLGRSGAPLDPVMKERLEKDLGGLKDPW
jgi:tetratricopeptide (TPR) repeat protein